MYFSPLSYYLLSFRSQTVSTCLRSEVPTAVNIKTRILRQQTQKSAIIILKVRSSIKTENRVHTIILKFEHRQFSS
jgi:hypothetical protein